MKITNADKQARFRKKEALKKYAEQVFRESSMSLHSRYAPEDILLFLNKATDLPTAWTDEDYALAERSIQQFRLDLFSTRDQIAVDVFDGRDVQAAFTSTSNNASLRTATRAATKNAHDLASHLISACNLSSCIDADKAAALLEVMRFLGRSLSNAQKVPRSQATTMCLSALGQHYQRPDWFAEQLAKMFADNLGADLSADVCQRLTKLGAHP